MLEQIFRNRRALVTGHTGFKGSWLCEWLVALGADVWGMSLPPNPGPALFNQLRLEERLHHRIGDIRDRSVVKEMVNECRPDFVFHLAAQPLVRASYECPVETYATNVMGTVHLLESLRCLTKPCAAVMVTTDKCYENREWERAYSEEDALGGHDPYSSSKGAAEIAISAYRRSFFAPEKLLAGLVPPVALASARAGNVIGGGDWALDRIVPDCVRSLEAQAPIGIRNPEARRPWQHVLDALGGYLTLAATLWIGLTKPTTSSNRLHSICSAFNFGPNDESNRSVRQLVQEILQYWPGTWSDLSHGSSVHEARLLKLSITKAERVLAWHPLWSFEKSVKETMTWYRELSTQQCSSEAQSLTRRQIKAFGDLHIDTISKTHNPTDV